MQKEIWIGGMNMEKEIEQEIEMATQHLPPGSVRRVMQYHMKFKEKGFTADIVPAMCRYLEKQIAELTNAAADEAENAGRYRITLDHLKAAAERRGILIE